MNLVFGGWVVLALGAVLSLDAAPPPAPQGPTRSLFDGRTLDGWEGTPGLWSVQAGTLVGHPPTGILTRNEFLATTARYTNFVLRLQFRIRGTNGFINSGVQIRSDRVPKSSEMAGYQCDLGDPTWWGSLYDESRRNRTLAWSDMDSLNRVLRREEWNDYVIVADGPRIATWINGVPGVDYYEPDPVIARVGGHLGFQIHAEGAPEASFRNIELEELPERVRPTGASAPPNPPHASPLSPEEQVTTFSLPPGFQIELVAAEPDGGKFVPLTFDHAGRLWTSTALEYPVDANEAPAEAKALYARGGRDRILVFDTPTAAGRQKARVFAEGLAMPLGVLPYRDGALALYGTEIRRYADTNGDGREDRHDPILTGFGMEDSHLLPHQFTRAPGNWILMAQGAFNSSQVKSTDGTTTPFNKTKLARFRPDGSRFEIIGHGPCNIWGLVQDRYGEVFIQEANDQGWPLMPFLEGGSYPLCGDDVPRPYAPPFPKIGEMEMGGTGLSGLALSEGGDAFPAPWRDVFFVANPITRKIQAIRVHRGGVTDAPEDYANGWQLEHLPDFVLSSDPWFRPVALSLGPDGCLYIVDWYNHIISHNEVPRNHPDRDKLRGRIWRVRHESQPVRTAIPDLARVPEADLLKHLAAVNSWEANAAWQAIGDRQTRGLIPALQGQFENQALPVDQRLRALWALEELQGIAAPSLRAVFGQTRSRSLRKELVRISADANLPLPVVVDLAQAALADSDHLVRQEGLRSLGKVLDGVDGPRTEARNGPVAGDAVRNLLNAAVNNPTGAWSKAPAYFRDFERYLVRTTLERHRSVVVALLERDSSGIQSEVALFGAVAIGGPDGAKMLARWLPQLTRPLNSEELLLAASAAQDQSVRTALQQALMNPATWQLLLDQRARLGSAEALLPLLEQSIRTVLASAAGGASADLAVRLAATFRLRGLEAELIGLVTAPDAPIARQIGGVRALREMGSTRVDVFSRLAANPNAALRTEVITALASAPSESALPALLPLWPGLATSQRRMVVDRLATTPAGATRLVAAIRAGDLPREDLDGSTLDKLTAILPADAFVRELQIQLGISLQPVLRLNGTEDARLENDIHLTGAFTVESWIRLEPGLSNADSLLGGPGLDLNFYDARFRVFVGGQYSDIAVATKLATAEVWTHIAVTRDTAGTYRIYLNGELDRVSTQRDPQDLKHLRIGASTAAGGTAADFVEYRIWNTARTADEIRSTANLALRPGPPGLIFHGHGTDWGNPGPGARIERTGDLPPIETEAQAAEMRTKFRQFREGVAKPGDVERGRATFTTTCGICHSLRGQGGKIGPALDGAGANGDEALLRNILTPNAAMEAGYRRFRIETKDGEIHEGLLAASDADSLTLRQPNTEDQKFLRTTVRRAEFLRGSMMPEGLLESLPPAEVPHLFAFLRTLGGSPAK